MAVTSHRITINAPQERVFHALSTTEGLKSWYTPHFEGTVGKDQEVVFRFTDREPFRWKFVELTPNSVVRWECIEGPGSASGTSVTFEIFDKGGQ